VKCARKRLRPPCGIWSPFPDEVECESLARFLVIPAKAGIQTRFLETLDSSFRGNDDRANLKRFEQSDCQYGV